jgi:hypothetical protein
MNTSYRHSGHSIRAVRIPGDDTSATLPTVVTSNATNVTTTSATLNGEVTDDGNDEIIARGFVYGTSPTNLSNDEQCGAGTGSYSMDIEDLTTGITYYYRAYATNNVGTAYGTIKTFETVETQLNGHDYVDLGLPSGTLWATCNVGANSPEEYGDYFAWGEISTKSSYSSGTYYYSDNPTTLPTSVDAATANWGSDWRMPTKAEFDELISNCTVIWTTQNGVYGRRYTGTNGNSIFLPAAGYYEGSSLRYAQSYGYYWSSSLNTSSQTGAYHHNFGSYMCGTYSSERYNGESIRPVRNN